MRSIRKRAHDALLILLVYMYEYVMIIALFYKGAPMLCYDYSDPIPEGPGPLKASGAFWKSQSNIPADSSNGGAGPDAKPSTKYALNRR